MADLRRHLLLIAYYYPPDTEAGGLRPFQFARYLPEFGIDTTVLTASEAPVEARRPEAVYVRNRTRRPIRTRPLGFTEMALRKFLFPHDEGMLWSAFAYPTATRLVQPGSFVLSSFPPVNTHLLALRLKRQFSIRWIADFRDPLVGAPTRLVPNQVNRFRKWAEALDRRIENAVFRHADLILANTDEVAQRWQQRHPESAGKVHLLWNGFDSAEPMTPLPIPKRDRRELVHVGGIFASRHPNALLESCSRLIQNGRLDPSAYRIRLVGVLEPQAIHDRAGFDHLVSLGFLEATGHPVPRSQAQQIVREADYLLLLDVLDFGGAQQLPSKIFEYLQIGRPILSFTVPNSPVERILDRGGVPHLTLYADAPPEKVDQAVTVLFSRSSAPVRPSDWFWETFDARSRVKTLATLLDGLDRKPHA